MWSIKYLDIISYFFPIWVAKCVELRLMDQFIDKQNWTPEIFDSSKTLNYRIFKADFGFVNYFVLVLYVYLDVVITVYQVKRVDGIALQEMRDFVPFVTHTKLVMSIITFLVVIF